MIMRGAVLLILVGLICYGEVNGQETPASQEQMLENLADSESELMEDDGWIQDLEQFRKNPVPINRAGERELRALRLLNDLQISRLLSYRKIFGDLADLYELQAIPGWDIATIRKLLPFITIREEEGAGKSLFRRFRSGTHSLLLRVSRIWEHGENSVAGKRYNGSDWRILARYRYEYRDLLRFGWLGDKDAGESFFRGVQRIGFDFNSVHFFARKIGVVETLALGDFTVNMGQGLIQWQTLAFGKSSGMAGLKRQSPVLAPHRSAGEYFFYRGAGITFRKGRIEATTFISVRRLSAHIETDTLSGLEYARSINKSGYHRTGSEQADRYKLGQVVMGLAGVYSSKRVKIGLNGIRHVFSLPVKKSDEPYNRYAWHGRNQINGSVDYSYTGQNFHFFGEAAADRDLHGAILNGLLVSVDPRVDIGLVHRVIPASYQTVSGNAFTENSSPSNERGLFTGICLRPADGWVIDINTDLFQFPWLKYRVDAPSGGFDYQFDITYFLGKQTEIQTRFQFRNNITNSRANQGSVSDLQPLNRKNWRMNVSLKLSPAFTLRARSEMVWVSQARIINEKGSSFYTELIYKPLRNSISGSFRYQYFETDGYDSRVYSFENDVLYSYSVPSVYGHGARIYLNIIYKTSPGFKIWLRWAQTVKPSGTWGLSNPAGLSGTRESEFKIQAYMEL
ncbi:MAG: ComEA family DNA-binding protein [Chitinophagaceae bacterium]